MDSEPYNWFKEPPDWRALDDQTNLLKPLVKTVDKKTLDEIIKTSKKFPIKFPIETVRCHHLKEKIPQTILETNINSTYPVIHEHTLHLYSSFLNHQKKFGSNRKFYEKMTLLDLVERLLSKRAVSFVGVHDYYQLLDGTTGAENWETVGTPDETPPLTLKNCLSYDEMKLAALLSISSHTVFINDGARNNCGKYQRDNVEEGGVIIGLIGPRLPKECVMEHREVIISPKQNTHVYGYGNFFLPTLQGMFLNFYGAVSRTYKESLKIMEETPDRYLKFVNGEFFDTWTYARRLILSIDTLLIEANDRAKKLNKMAYIHVVGLGLGVWKIHHEQDRIFMETFLNRLVFLLGTLTNVSDVCFAYIKHKMAGEYKNGDLLAHIRLHMLDKAGPHVKLSGEDEGKLLVVSYAWDCNAQPGNEFWSGSLHTSSDPAAACSTQVAELHNWHINGNVTASKLMIATLKNGLVSFAEYQDLYK